MSKREKERILGEIKLYKHLDHPNILKLIKAWRNQAKDEVLMITELMTCSLKEYLHKKTERPRLRVIKNWCKSILRALDYLHSSNPPVIHRDLKCDNIFILSSSAEIRIGDLGLSTTLEDTHLKSQVGTPYFMAPEMYEENYGLSVDIYSFGLCVIEMCTLSTPYSECKNQAALFQKLKSGEKPEAFFMITDQEVQNFISLCILPAQYRPTAKQLLSYPFLSIRDDDSAINKPVIISAPFKPPNRDIVAINSEIEGDILKVNLIIKDQNESKFKVDFEFNANDEVPEKVAEELIKSVQLKPESLKIILDILEGKKRYETSIQDVTKTPYFHGNIENRVHKFSIKLGIQEETGVKKVQVDLSFDLDTDTVDEVALETVKNLGLDMQEVPQVAWLLRKKISEVENKTNNCSYLDLLDMDNANVYRLDLV